MTLAEGDNVIKVKVTAEDTTATKTYTVTVSRAAAASTCTLNTGDLHGAASSRLGRAVTEWDLWLPTDRNRHGRCRRD